MIRRLAFAVAVLTATIYWANCKFEPPRAQPADPTFNAFFAGCFQGAVTDPPGFGDFAIVLEAKPDDKLMLGGCARVSPVIGAIDTGALTGAVLDDGQKARVTVTPTSGTTPFTLLVTRNPAGEVNAMTVDVVDENGVPFASASNLQRCTLTCSTMGIPMPFLPGGGGQ